MIRKRPSDVARPRRTLPRLQSGEAAPTTLFSTDGLPGFFPDRFSRRSTSSPTAGAGVSRRRLEKQRANHLFLLTESPQSVILRTLSKQRTPRWP